MEQNLQQPPPQNNPKLTARILSIVGLVIGVVALIFSLIPCVGYYALVPSIIGFILSGIGFIMQMKNGLAAHLSLIAGIFCILAIAVSIYQYIAFKSVFDTKARATRMVEGFEEKVEKEAADAVIDYTKNKIDDYLEKDSIEDAKKAAQK